MTKPRVLNDFKPPSDNVSELPVEHDPIYSSDILADRKQNYDDNKILILKRDQTKDVRYEKFIERLIKKDDQRHKGNIRFLKLDKITDDDSEVESSITMLKPLSQKISPASYDSIKTTFQDSFSKSQLVNFVATTDPSKRILSKSKSKIIDIIVKDLWKIKVSSNNSPTLDDVLHTEVVNLSDIDLFLLLLHNGLITTHLSKTVYKLSFDSKLDHLILTGSASQIENAKLNLNKCLEGVYREVVNLATYNRLFREKFKQLFMEKRGMFTEVYFNQIDKDVYQLVALSKAQVKRTKRLLLWHLNYDNHTRSHLVLPAEKPSLLLPFKHDDALPWNERKMDLFALKYPESKPSPELLDSIDKLSDSTLASQAYSFSIALKAQEGVPSKDVYDRLSSLLLIDDESSKEDFDPYAVIGQAQRDELYAKLTDFTYRRSLRGLQEDRVDEPIFSITLGNLLFSREAGNEIIPHASSVEDMGYTFNTNIAFASDKALELPFYHSTGLSRAEMKDDEPFDTAVQLRFLPSPFVDEADNMQYPPIEIWGGLTRKSVLDMDSVRLVTNEGENHMYVSLPEKKADMKLSCHVFGNLLQTHPLSEQNHENDDNDDNEDYTMRDILASTSSRFQQFEHQPGIKQFFEKSSLNYNGRAINSVHPYMDVDFNGKTVRYHYISMSIRKVLFLSYNSGTDPENDRMVELNLIEGGSLGGRRVEINFVGDEYSPEEFNRLVDYALTFANDL